MPETSEHRRKYPRLPSRNTVLVRVLGGDGEGFAKTKVVGLGGCLFTSDLPLGRETYLEALIAVHPTVVKALCKVVYEKPLEDGRYDVGVEFVQIRNSDRMLLETLWATARPSPDGDWE